jgi:hypothetical protein
MSRILVACVLVFTIGAGGCGTTTIVTNDSHAKIFVDGAMIGRGQGGIQKRGMFGDAQVVVKAPDGRRQVQQISRSFTLTTFLLSFITYGVCLVACWEYPDSVYVMLDEVAKGSWGPEAGAVDPWLSPPPGWTPPAKAP